MIYSSLENLKKTELTFHHKGLFKGPPNDNIRSTAVKFRPKCI